MSGIGNIQGSSQSSQVVRFKTEAAYPYLQYLTDRKKKSTGVLDIKKINEVWKNNRKSIEKAWRNSNDNQY